MAPLKTKATGSDVQRFLETIKDDVQRRDTEAVVAMMTKATKAPPKMWGAKIVGFGSRTVKYDSGRELDWFVIGLSPRKQALTLYLGLGGFEPPTAVMKKLGKHTTGKGCLYVKRLEDIHVPTLQKLIGLAATRKK